MIPFAIYLLKVTICSAILLGYYWGALRNKTFHQWNRFYLLLVVVVSLAIPFLKIPISFGSGAGEVVRYFSAVSVDETVVVMSKGQSYFSFSAENWAFVIYLSVSCLLLFLIVKAAKEAIAIIRKYPSQKLGQVYFLDTDANGAPFSFFNYIIWNHEIDLMSKTGQQIFQHELAHVQQRHTLDKVFLLLVLIPFWINPFFWLIRKELHALHEFLADQQALEDGSSEDLSKMILNSLYPQQTFLLSNHFFQSSIKRRLHMFAIKNKKISYLSRVLALPLIVIIGAAFSLKDSVNTSLDASIARVHKTSQKETFTANPLSATEDTNPLKGAKGVLMDTKNKIYLESDNIIQKPPEEKYTGPQTALLIVDGKKVDNSIWADKTIISKQLTVYPKDDQEAIRLYGQEAAKGTFVFEGAKIISKKESELYQSLQNPKVSADRDEREQPIFTQVEVEPKFIGNWQTFLQNLDPKVPVTNGAPAGSYTVEVKFLVSKEGKLSDFKALTSHGFGMEEEVIKLMKKSPDWDPALQNGIKVAAYKVQKVTFVISEQ